MTALYTDTERKLWEKIRYGEQPEFLPFRRALQNSEKLRSERFAAKLGELGISPENI